MSNFNFYLNRQGIRGRQGEKGDKGEQGYSPYIEIKSDTPTEFIMTIHNENESFDTPNLIPQSIGNKVAELDERVTETEADITANTSSIQRLDGIAVENISAIGKLESEVRYLNTDTQKNTSDISDLKNVNNNIQNTLNRHTNSIQYLDEEVGNLTSSKQNKLVAGNNITLSDNTDGTTTISSTGGGGGGSGDVTAAGNNTFTGSNTFKQSIRINNNTDPYLSTFVNNNGLGIQNYDKGEITVRNNMTPVPLKITASKLTLNTNDTTEANVLTSDSLKAGDNVSLTKDEDMGTITISAISAGGAPINDTTIATDKVWSSSKTNSEITTVANEVVQIQGDVASLDADISELKPQTQANTEAIGSINDSISVLNNKTKPATSSTLGLVKPDGTTITVTEDGTISANSSYTLPTASTTQLGGVKVDGTSVTINSDGVISAAGGGSTPENMVTTDTKQIITGAKTFTNLITFNNTLNMSTANTNTLYIHANGSYAQGYTTDIDAHKNLNIKTKLGGGAITLAPMGSSLNGLKYRDSSNTSNPSYDILHTGNLVAGNNITISEPNSTGVRTISGPSDEYMAHMAMPSNRYVDLTLGASGSSYTAPADGYVSFLQKINKATTQLSAFNIGVNGNVRPGFGCNRTGTTFGVGLVRGFIPVRKGDSFYVSYTLLDTSYDGAQLRFHYAEGIPSA